MAMAKQESISFFEFKETFNNEDVCREHLFHIRWPEVFTCPKCGNRAFYLSVPLAVIRHP